jgi:hypothetical protein
MPNVRSTSVQAVVHCTMSLQSAWTTQHNGTMRDYRGWMVQKQHSEVFEIGLYVHKPLAIQKSHAQTQARLNMRFWVGFFYKQYQTCILHLGIAPLLYQCHIGSKNCDEKVTKYRPENNRLTVCPMSDWPVFKPWCTAVCPCNQPDQPNTLAQWILMGVKCFKSSTQKSLKLVSAFTGLH